MSVGLNGFKGLYDLTHDKEFITFQIHNFVLFFYLQTNFTVDMCHRYTVDFIITILHCDKIMRNILM